MVENHWAMRPISRVRTD